MAAVRISSKGWIVIPAKLRKKYKLKPGMKVDVIDYEGKLGIVPVPDDPVAMGAGMFRGGASLTKALLEERAKDREREERKIERFGAR